jgi:hypothetical protein
MKMGWVKFKCSSSNEMNVNVNGVRGRVLFDCVNANGVRSVGFCSTVTYICYICNIYNIYMLYICNIYMLYM